VVVSRTSTGIVTVDWSATGVSGADAQASARHATNPHVAAVTGMGANSCTVKCVDAIASALVDSDFTLWIY
jgi:hypothetical protein